MKKKYTKKQIVEAIAFWKKQLKKLNERSYSNLTAKIITDPGSEICIRIAGKKEDVEYYSNKIYAYDETDEVEHTDDLRETNDKFSRIDDCQYNIYNLERQLEQCEDFYDEDMLVAKDALKFAFEQP